MITGKVGQRIKSKRRGCKADYGTIIAVERPDWILVQWDHGPECHVFPDEGRLSDVNKGPFAKIPERYAHRIKSQL